MSRSWRRLWWVPGVLLLSDPPLTWPAQPRPCQCVLAQASAALLTPQTSPLPQGCSPGIPLPRAPGHSHPCSPSSPAWPRMQPLPQLCLLARTPVLVGRSAAAPAPHCSCRPLLQGALAFPFPPSPAQCPQCVSNAAFVPRPCWVKSCGTFCGRSAWLPLWMPR